MSERGTVGPKATPKKVFQTIEERLTTLEQRPQGGANGLIAPGGATAQGWQNIDAYSGTWQDTATAGQQLPQYCLDADGWVHLRGFVKNTVTFAAGVITNLPAGYRPAATEYFATPNGGGAGPGISQISVGPTGDVRFENLVGNGWNATNWMSLSNISFYVGGQ